MMYAERSSLDTFSRVVRICLLCWRSRSFLHLLLYTRSRLLTTWFPSNIPDAYMGHVPKQKAPDGHVNIRVSGIGGHGGDRRPGVLPYER